MTDASAILVILSKNSVASEWCKRELSAGLVRELEEKRTLVMACVIDDCEIPLFMRDKLYANFVRDPDGAWQLLDRSLSKYVNPYQSRDEKPNFHTDWALNCQVNDGNALITWTFVDHGHDWPYVILSECNVVPEPSINDAVAQRLVTDRDSIVHSVAQALVESVERAPLDAEPLDNNEAKFVAWRFTISRLGTFGAIYSYRRLGEDNGMNTVVYPENNLRTALKHFSNVVRQN